MDTIMAAANAGKITPLLRKAAKQEKIPLKLMAKLIGEGKVVIPANAKRQVANPCAIGKMMRVKINANIGTSPDKINIEEELIKLSTAIRFGADTVMDLSIGGEINKIQKLIIKNSSVPVGTVPIYEAAINAAKKYGTFLKMTKNDMLDVLVSQAENGVDFFTIHAGITRKTLASLKRQRRLMGIVSRGGAITAKWIEQNKQENPLYAYFDEVLQIAGQYDITLSLGDGLRPGTIHDATDKPQIDELRLLGSLAKRALRKGVQVMIEGPGHIPINQIKKNIELQKKFCGEAPFYVLGPLVTDSALGYDHIAAAIGSGLAATYGADFLCFVTPAEHLKLPDIEDVKLGVIASRIAAHAADLARGNKRAWEKDKKMSLARKKRDWDCQIALSIDPQMVESKRNRSKPKVNDACTMCGDFCSIRLMDKSRKGRTSAS